MGLRWAVLPAVALVAACRAALPPGVEPIQPATIAGKPYGVVKGLLPGRYSTQKDALRAACDKYLNLPGAFNPFDRNRDPISWRDYWTRASTEYCGIVFKTGVDEYGNSTITRETIQGRGRDKTCTYPDFVLVEGSSGDLYADKKALSHNHSGGTTLSHDDCLALEDALAFQASAMYGVPTGFSMTMAVFVGRQGLDRVLCDGWYELTIQYSGTGYQGSRANVMYFDASADGYDAAKSVTLDLGNCEVAR